MSWYVEPRLAEREEGAVVVWSLSGDWTRDLPMDVRRDASSRLGGDIARPLLVNLVDVTFIDSWGEELLADTIQTVLDLGSSVALVIDRTRRAEFEGLRHVIERRQLGVKSFEKLDEALADLVGVS